MKEIEFVRQDIRKIMRRIELVIKNTTDETAKSELVDLPDLAERVLDKIEAVEDKLREITNIASSF